MRLAGQVVMGGGEGDQNRLGQFLRARAHRPRLDGEICWASGVVHRRTHATVECRTCAGEVGKVALECLPALEEALRELQLAVQVGL